MSTHRNLMTVCFAAVFALGLAACSSSSDDDPPPAMDMTETPDPDPAIAQRAAMNDAVAAASTAVGAVNNDSTDEMVMAADDAIAAATAAIEAAADVPEAETASATAHVADLQTSLDNAKAARMASGEAADEAARAAADLMETQTEAADAADAAMASATAAAEAAMGAEEATENVATLQTGGTAMAAAMDARKYADAAAAEAKKAADASAAAGEATTGSEAEAQARIALNAQEAAKSASDTAIKKAEAATEAAKSELHIDGTVKYVQITDEDGMVTGKSSIDATMGALIDRDDDGEVTMRTGRVAGVSRTIAAVAGQDFNDNRAGLADADNNTPNDPSDDDPYIQAVAQGSVLIGKTLDTTDDMARLTIVDSRADTDAVRVYGIPATRVSIVVTTTAAGAASATRDGTALPSAPTLRPVGPYYLAANTADRTTEDGLVAADQVATTGPASTPDQLFLYLDLGTDNAVDGGDDVLTYTVETSRTVSADGTVTVTYNSVDVTAPAAPARRDIQELSSEVQVTADIPTAMKYEHIHFGVWAGLTDNEDGDNSVLADLGIGFVQNFDGSGVTTGHVTGTATYNGDWVAVVRPMHRSTLASDTGSATLTANFSEDEFTAALAGLATLEGSLSGNTFSGTDATVTHRDMDASGTFAGSFDGAIYGEDGAEAAGVFSFDGDDAGAFVGAFGGRDVDQ